MGEKACVNLDKAFPSIVVKRCNLISSVFALAFYTIFFICVPARVFFSFVNVKDRLVVGPWLAIFLHVLFFEVSVFLGFRDIGNILYPLFFLTVFSVRICHFEKTKALNEFRFAVNPINGALVLALLYGLVLAYFLMGSKLSLPENGKMPSVWLDLAHFSSLVSSLREYVVAHDFHIFGVFTRYHLFCYQWAAAISSVFHLDSLSTVVFFIPAALISYVIFSLYYFFRAMNLTSLCAALVTLFCLLTSCFGAFPSFVAGLDTAFNLFSSPSMLMSIGFSVCILLLFLSESVGTYTYVFLLCCFSFALVGTKVSTAFVVLLGCGLFGLAIIKRENWKQVLIALSFMAVSSGLSYIFYFYEENPSIVTNVNIAIPGPLFVTLNTFPSYIKQTMLGAFIGVIYRYWPWWGLLFAVSRLKKNGNEYYRRLFLVCGAVGIFSSFLLDTRGNELHFYHIGLFCILLYVSSHLENILVSKSRVISGWLICIAIACVFPVWGNAFYPHFNGYEAISGVPIIRPTELDGNLLEAYRFIKEKSPVRDLVLTAQDRLDSPVLGKGSYNFFASAISERQVFIEGWAFSKFYARQPDEKDLVLSLLTQRDEFYASKDSVSGVHILNKIKPQWIVWDRRISGEVPSWIENCFSQKTTFGPVTVIKTEISPTEETSLRCGAGS